MLSIDLKNGKDDIFMADRKQFFSDVNVDPELQKALELAKERPLTEQELQEQRVSFAFGNAPASAKGITKDSVRNTSKHILLQP